MTVSTAELSYREALRAIQDRGRYGIRLGLGRIRALLRELGDPQTAVRGALVAGTNGKGSVLALAGAALEAAGYRVGQTPKPHLVTYRERLQVNGRPIAAEDFSRLVAEVLAAEFRIGARHGPATEFELLTAMVFRWFAEVGIDVALVEVGLGGRLDATHAWDGGVAVVTNVSLDHTDRLGTTIPKIAREKAAIIEPGDLAVTGADGEALEVVMLRAARLGVPLAVAPPAAILGWDRDGLAVDLAGLGEVRVGLRGRHQAANVAVADATLDALAAAGIAEAPVAARRSGYAAARWPGRLELVDIDGREGGREILLDGAHNPAGAAALAVALDDLRPFLAGGRASDPPPLTVVTAMMADKDVDGSIRALAAAAALTGARIVTTIVPGGRAVEPEGLAERWRVLAPAIGSAEAVDSVDVVLDRIVPEARGPLVVTGSLYLVGAVRARIVDDPALRDPESGP